MNLWIANRWKMMLLCAGGYFLVSLIIQRMNGHFIHELLVWNLVLALPTLVFALLLYKSRRAPWRLVWGGAWFLFFPNAPYLMTDLMHIAHLRFYGNETGGLMARLAPWFTLTHLSIGVFLGNILGLVSLHIVHRRIAERGDASCKVLGWLIVCLACLASGYAMYIGRFLRFNSWDVFQRPIALLRGLVWNMDGFSLGLTMLFSAYVLCSYFFFYAFCAGHGEGSKVTQ